MRYREIADELSARLLAGEFPAGRLLPSESELSAAYGASRVTVRRALEHLRTAGLVDSRQGFGWFAAVDPLRQSLGRLGTIEAQLAASGVVPERRVLGFAFVAAPAPVAAVLGEGPVLQVRRVNLADGNPFARVTVWCPEALGAELSRADVERSPFYELLGIELGGASQVIGAVAAPADDAAVLEVPAGSPLLRCWRVTTSVSGEPVLVSEHVFPAHRTEFVVELSTSAPSIAPTGIRLVE
ncbi:MAG TPA: GntR family transcriptional regulator [Acidimicrobiales bacterium]|nr:GntR family transcriptional regulator [Acidimicrobiales bacterium]